MTSYTRPCCRLRRTAAHLKAAHPPPVSRHLPEDDLAGLEVWWCTPWRHLDDPHVLAATQDCLVRLEKSSLLWNTHQAQLVYGVLRATLSSTLSLPATHNGSSHVGLDFDVATHAAACLTAWAASVMPLPASAGADADLVRDIMIGAACAVEGALRTSSWGCRPRPAESQLEHSALALWGHAGRVGVCDLPHVASRLLSLLQLANVQAYLCSVGSSRLADTVRLLLVETCGTLDRGGGHLYALACALLSALTARCPVDMEALEIGLEPFTLLTCCHLSAFQQAEETSRAVCDTLKAGSRAAGVAAIAAALMLRRLWTCEVDALEFGGQVGKLVEGLLQFVRIMMGREDTPDVEDALVSRAAGASAVVLLIDTKPTSTPAGRAAPLAAEDAGLLMTTLLRVVLGDTTALFEHPSWVQFRRCCIRGKHDRAACAVAVLFKLSLNTQQAEALSILRAFAQSATAESSTGGPGDGVLLVAQICAQLTIPSHSALSPGHVVWLMDALSWAAAGPPDPQLGLVVDKTTDQLRVCLDHVDTRPTAGEEDAARAVREWVLLELEKRSDLDRRHAVLLRLATAVCIECSRPAAYVYVSKTVGHLLRTLHDGAVAAGPVATAQAHKCIRALITRPQLLAWRAGPDQHWDDARRRLLAAYIKAVAASFPSSTSEEDLAYCVGATVAALPRDIDGQAVLLHCMALIRDRALELCREDTAVHQHSTAVLLRLFFQTLSVCPDGTVEALGEAVIYLVHALPSANTTFRVLTLLREVVAGELETTRQSRLARLYLRLVDQSDLDDRRALLEDGAEGGGVSGGGVSP